MARKRNPGIYAIKHIESGKLYIGSSVTPAERLVVHRRELRYGIHSNLHLQNAWIKYGEKAFLFEILEENISVELLENKENDYLIYFGIADKETNIFNEKKGYNMCWAGREGFKDPTRQKRGKDHHSFGKPSLKKDKTFEEMYGEERAKELKKLTSENSARAKTFLLTDNDDKEIVVKNLMKFCRENNYNTSSLGHFKCGKIKNWCGYKSIRKMGGQ
jgi:group I intron endonuclease